MPESLVAIDPQASANPAPLGLFGFGITTVLLNLHNAGFFALGPMILAMGIFYGGLAQLIAGVLEWKKNNTFGMVAFTSYGCFWLSLVAILMLPKLTSFPAADENSMAAYLFMWGLFTGGLFVGTLRLSVALRVVFASLTVLFFALAACDFFDAPTSLRVLTGLEGIFCGFSACYAGLALVLNELYGRSVLPLGEVKSQATAATAPATNQR